MALRRQPIDEALVVGEGDVGIGQVDRFAAQVPDQHLLTGQHVGRRAELDPSDEGEALLRFRPDLVEGSPLQQQVADEAKAAVAGVGKIVGLDRRAEGQADMVDGGLDGPAPEARALHGEMRLGEREAVFSAVLRRARRIAGHLVAVED